MTAPGQPRRVEHARDLLVRDLATVPQTATVGQARSLMRHLAVRHVPVLGDDGLVGLLQESERLARHDDSSVLDHVVRDVPDVHPRDGLDRVEEQLRASPCGAVVVLDDDGRLLGVITTTDLDAVPLGVP